MWHLGTWFRSGLGSAGLVLGLDDLRGLFPPKPFHGSAGLCLGTLLCSPGVDPREAAQPWEQELPSPRGPWALGRPGPGAARPLTPRLSPASTLSQLSDSGQTLSEDSGVDIGEVETSGKDKSRQPGPGKSRSLKEATRSEGAAEGASKPVRGVWGAALRGRGHPELCPTALAACCTPLPAGSRHSSVLCWGIYPLC